MMSDSLPLFVPVVGAAIFSVCCAIRGWCTANGARQQVNELNQRLLALEQAPVKILVHEPTAPVYYPPPVVTQPQPKPSAPPATPQLYGSFYPPYSSAYQGQQLPIVR